MVEERASGRDRRDAYRSFVLRVLIVLGLVAFALLLWRIRDAFLLAFGSVIIAVILVAAARPIERWTELSRSWSLAIAGGAILLVLVLLAWLVGTQLQSQIAELSGRLPQAVQSLEQQFGIPLPGEALSGSIPQQGETGLESGQNQTSDFSLIDDLLGQIVSWSRTAFTVVTGLILVVIGGVFFAANPDIYRRGLIKLFPSGQHERVGRTLTECGRALYLWLLAQLLAMAIIGVLAGLGTWAIGLPAPLALGLFAAITEFVPIAGAVPALLLALSQSTGAFLWTLALYIAIQQLESNVITPLIEKRMVEVPPALFLFSVLAFGLLFGILGILIAAPLTVVVFVAVKKLYVRDALGEQTDIPGMR